MIPVPTPLTCGHKKYSYPLPKVSIYNIYFLPCCGFYLRISVDTNFFDIPNDNEGDDVAYDDDDDVCKGGGFGVRDAKDVGVNGEGGKTRIGDEKVVHASDDNGEAKIGDEEVIATNGYSRSIEDIQLEDN